jgi:hypothetical protein
MYLIEIFLPLCDLAKNPFPQQLFSATRDELVVEFGGLTAYSRTPVVGLWSDKEGNVVRDDVVIYEVIAERWDRSWWVPYQRTLEKRFAQEKMMIRSHEVSML